MEQEFIQLAEQIMPRNWHILTEPCEFRQSHVYLTLLVYDSFDLTEEMDCVGRVKGPMRYFEGSAFAHIDLFLADPVTLIHELAHIGQYRIQARRTGSYRFNGLGVLVFDLGDSPDHHDGDFLAAYECLIDRAIPFVSDYDLLRAHADLGLWEEEKDDDS